MFPLDTLDCANQKAEALKESLHSEGKDTSLENRARKLYEHGTGIEFGYWEAVQQGIWSRYPHEIVSQAECGELATYLYVIGKFLGLKPRIFFIDKVKEINGIQPVVDVPDHLFIDVEVDKDRIAVDPLFRAFGPVEFSSNTIYLPQEKITVKVGSLVQVSEEELLEALIELRKPKGLIKMLLGNQILKRDVPYHDIFPSLTMDRAFFDPTTNTLTFQVYAFESVGDTHSKWQRTYTYRNRRAQTSDSVSDLLLTPDGSRLLKEIPLNEPHLLNMEDTTLAMRYLGYRTRVIETARNNGRRSEDTYLHSEEELVQAIPLVINAAMPPFQDLPEAYQRAFKRKVDYHLFARNNGIQFTQNALLDEYMSIKFPKAKFEPHLEKGDYLAERVLEVL